MNMSCSCCLAGKFHGLNGLAKPSCKCTCPPDCNCGCRNRSKSSKRGGCGCGSSKRKATLSGTDCGCGCGGTCGCGPKQAMGGLSGTDCGCGCGGTCGCGPKQAMGSFDEYPRPKSALFDPRQIDRVWPEPHPDPLIPYVRANEGLLPYSSVNRYKGQQGSLHGYLAMGDDTPPTNTTPPATPATDATRIATLESEMTMMKAGMVVMALAGIGLCAALFVNSRKND